MAARRSIVVLAAVRVIRTLERVSSEVSRAYARRAAEYTDLFGSMSAVDPADRQLISTWADGLEDPVVDAGCGPGQWTNLLTELGLSARGVDQVPEFIDRASRVYPGSRFQIGDLNRLEFETGSVGGLLSWYSLIHHEPDAIAIPLAEFHRVLRPAGALLIGFFEGDEVEQFDHAVTAAYRWSVPALTEKLSAAGFDVIESRVRKRSGERPQAAIIARRASLP